MYDIAGVYRNDTSIRHGQQGQVIVSGVSIPQTSFWVHGLLRVSIRGMSPVPIALFLQV